MNILVSLPQSFKIMLDLCNNNQNFQAYSIFLRYYKIFVRSLLLWPSISSYCSIFTSQSFNAAFNSALTASKSFTYGTFVITNVFKSRSFRHLRPTSVKFLQSINSKYLRESFLNFKYIKASSSMYPQFLSTILSNFVQPLMCEKPMWLMPASSAIISFTKNFEFSGGRRL